MIIDFSITLISVISHPEPACPAGRLVSGSEIFIDSEINLSWLQVRIQNDTIQHF
jgi:hypothetical protein